MIPLGQDTTEEQLHTHCRAYILGLIGGVLMPDKQEKSSYYVLTIFN